MVYAPVIIPTLCRYDHFVQCIESLKQNHFAKYTEIYIGLDYPTKESHWDGYNKIKAFLDRGIEGFKEVHLYIREKNLGAAENIYDLLREAGKEHDRYILSEDDNIFSPCFLEYENIMLDAIKNDDSIFAVCGYSYPIKWSDPEKMGIIKLQSFFSAWGYGTLFKKRDDFWKVYTKEFFEETINDRKKMNRLKKQSPKNFVDYINIVWFQQVRDYDVNINSYLILENKYSVMPDISLVRNCGWDGSGINCSNTSYDYSSQPIIEDKVFSLNDNGKNLSNIKHYYENEIKINEFYPGKRKDIMKASLKLFIMRLGLREACFKMKKVISKLGR